MTGTMCRFDQQLIKQRLVIMIVAQPISIWLKGFSTFQFNDRGSLWIFMLIIQIQSTLNPVLRTEITRVYNALILLNALQWKFLLNDLPDMLIVRAHSIIHAPEFVIIQLNKFNRINLKTSLEQDFIWKCGITYQLIKEIVGNLACPNMFGWIRRKELIDHIYRGRIRTLGPGGRDCRHIQ